MDHDYAKIITKIDQIIQTNGIQYYIKKWHKIDIPTHFDSHEKFIQFLGKYVAAYHHHSFIMSKILYAKYTKKYYDANKIEERPLPKFKYDADTKIGTIVFFHFYNDFDQTKTLAIGTRIINLVHKKYIRWQKLGLNGLIIDLRKHLGGNMWVAVPSLKDILGNTTLLSFNKVKTNFSDQKWINMANKEIKFDEKFLSSDIAFDKKIAIIVSNETASSGEIIASIFYGRKNVKIFGDKTNRTAGFASANETIKINDDISFLFTSDLITTVNGTFLVDEYIKVDQKTNTPIKNAKKWINK